MLNVSVCVCVRGVCVCVYVLCLTISWRVGIESGRRETVTGWRASTQRTDCPAELPHLIPTPAHTHTRGFEGVRIHHPGGRVRGVRMKHRLCLTISRHGCLTVDQRDPGGSSSKKRARKTASKESVEESATLLAPTAYRRKAACAAADSLLRCEGVLISWWRHAAPIPCQSRTTLCGASADDL